MLGPVAGRPSRNRGVAPGGARALEPPEEELAIDVEELAAQVGGSYEPPAAAGKSLVAWTVLPPWSLREEARRNARASEGGP